MWIVFSTISSVISIASLSDDFIAWSDFIVQVLNSYRAIVDSIWSSVLFLLPFEVPRWTHDYLTITSLMAVSVLWAFHSTSRTFGWGRVGSVVGVIKNGIFERTVGGNMFEVAEDRARSKMRSSGLTIAPATEAVLQRIFEPSRPVGVFVAGVFSVAFLVCALVLFPIAIPAFARWSDGRANRRSLALCRTRMKVLDGLSCEAATKSIVMSELEGCLSNAKGRTEIYSLYHNEIAKQILYYYLLVFVLFALLVLANHFLAQGMTATNSPSP